MSIFKVMQRSFACFLFEHFFRDHVLIDFKNAPGGKGIKIQIRMFGWMVGEQEITARKKDPKENQ